MINNIEIFNTFKWLLWRDIRVITKDYRNGLIDATLLPVTFAVLFGKIMPAMGMPVGYGAIVLIGTVNGMSMWTSSSEAGAFITDLSGVKSINYELTLPIYSSLIYIKYILFYAIKSLLISVLILPIGIILLNNINLDQISIFKFIFAYISMSLFFGTFALLAAITTKDIRSFGRFWTRFGWILFNLSGSQFNWAFMYKAMPIFAILNLFNPLVYPCEALKAAFLGPKECLPYSITITLTWIFTIIFTILGLIKFKRKLDYI